MPISTFNTNYTNRTVDINIMHVNSYTNGELQQDTIGFGNPSQFVTGIQKLVQRYTILFLTATNSQINSPTFGSSFVNSIQNNPSNITRVQVQHLFNFANINVQSVFVTYQANTANIPTDEQYQSATLTSFSATPDSIDLTILITSKAGTSVTFVLPIPLNN